VKLRNSKLISYQQLLAELNEIKTTSPRAFAIDGVAGAGKTTLAAQLNLDLPGSQIVHMDDLFNGWQEPLSPELTRRVINEILDPFINGKEFVYRKFNWYLEVFDETIKVSPADTLLLEGVGAGQRAFRKMLSRIIWVELDPAAGFERVIARDGERVKTQMENFLKDQKKHFAAELTNLVADYTISGVP